MQRKGLSSADFVLARELNSLTSSTMIAARSFGKGQIEIIHGLRILSAGKNMEYSVSQQRSEKKRKPVGSIRIGEGAAREKKRSEEKVEQQMQRRRVCPAEKDGAGRRR